VYRRLDRVHEGARGELGGLFHDAALNAKYSGEEATSTAPIIEPMPKRCRRRR
jgi:hypothetical protein